MKKIVIVYATAGEGHKRAAIAIKSAFDSMNTGDDIRLVDALDHTNDFFKRFYPGAYIFAVTFFPSIWGFFYYLSDFKPLYPLVRFLRRRSNSANAGPFERFLCDFKPDVVIATHFLACEVVSNLKREERLTTRLITCVTDFGMHSFWFADNTDFYCVGFEDTRRELIKKWSVPEERVQVFGMPIHPKFYAQKDQKRIRSDLNLSAKLPTFLITGGGFGVGPIVEIVKNLMNAGCAIQILVVCGHNEKLKTRIDSVIRLSPETLATSRTFGFVDFVDELMSVSDMSATKAGGLICSEAVAKELPLVIIAPIPGQESRNCRLLLRNKCAFEIHRPSQIKSIVKKICHDHSIIAGMKANIRKIRKENPAVAIAGFALGVQDKI